jgi:hypothetical protein
MKMTQKRSPSLNASHRAKAIQEADVDTALRPVIEICQEARRQGIPLDAFLAFLAEPLEGGGAGASESADDDEEPPFGENNVEVKASAFESASTQSR